MKDYNVQKAIYIVAQSINHYRNQRDPHLHQRIGTGTSTAIWSVLRYNGPEWELVSRGLEYI